MKINNKKIVVINGYGLLSPVGISNNATKGEFLRHFLSEETYNDKSYYVGKLSVEAEEYLNNLIKADRKLERYDRCSLMAIAASQIAVKGVSFLEKDIIGVNIGTSRGTTALFEKFHKDYIYDKENKTSIGTSPLTTFGNISSGVAANLSLKGPAIDNSTTCSSAIQSLANASAWLKSGMADKFIAGASESPLTGFTLAQIEALSIYSKGGNFPCRPFESSLSKKNSFVLGEAAGVFLLELFDSNNGRSKEPLAIIESFGYSFENPPSLTGISEDGFVLVKSMKMAIENMITEEPIDMVLLHGTGTIKGDNAELNAIKTVFGDALPYLYANKWQTGHTYAASATLNISIAIDCFRNNSIPEFPYKVLFPNSKRKIRKVLINAHGFGGNAASMIISCPSSVF